MPLTACTNCGMRYATPAVVCRRCRATMFRAAPVDCESATIEAVTTVRVGVGANGPVHLVIAQLSDIAVLAEATAPPSIGDEVTMSDAADGGFTTNGTS